MAAGKLGILTHIPLVDIIFNLYLESTPLYKSILPDSPTIRDTETETLKMWDQYHFEALSARSLFGSDEEIVHVGDYVCDKHEDTVPGQHHTTICKPRDGFPLPLRFVANAWTETERTRD